MIPNPYTEPVLILIYTSNQNLLRAENPTFAANLAFIVTSVRLTTIMLRATRNTKADIPKAKHVLMHSRQQLIFVYLHGNTITPKG